MIIIGYPGIGKSYNSGYDIVKSTAYIDLESHNFWNEYDIPYDPNTRRRDRDPNWFETYCKLAIDLSNQGYRVFVSSHMSVQGQLRGSKKHDIIVCYPHESLKQKWILRLRERYLNCLDEDTEKNRRAIEAVIENFDRDIDAMRHSGFPTLEIMDMEYNLRELIEDFLNLKEHWYE